MSNLSENIKKYFTSKLLDIFTIAVFIGAILLLMVFTSDWIAVVVGLIVLFVGVHFLSKGLNKLMDKWIVPKMERNEHETYQLIDTVTDVVIIAAIVKLLSTPSSIMMMSIVAGIIILIKEVIKWRKFLKDDDDEEDGDTEEPKETEKKEEEKQIQKNIEETQDAEIERMGKEKKSLEEAKKVITESYVDMAKEDVATTIDQAKTDDNPDKKEGEEK